MFHDPCSIYVSWIMDHLKSLPRQTLRQFNTRSHRIKYERDLQAEIRHFAIRSVERHTIRLQLLGECFKVLHLKTNVIERAAFRGSGRRWGIGGKEVHFVAVEHCRRKIPT